MIDLFDGDYRFLSNFYPVEVVFDAYVYRTVEHAYQAAKTLDQELRDGIRQLKSPGTVKKIAQYLPKREDWHLVNLTIMTDLVMQKFRRDDLRRLLLNTGHDRLVEGNFWHDNFYGICKCPKCPGEGTNHLGRILETVRDMAWQTVQAT